ncbi:hypothetical protein Efla_006694 [Eimeria flavescens]
MGLPKTDRGNDAIFTIVDLLSKMAPSVPRQITVTAEGVAELLADRLIRYHGLPEKFISNRDPRFVADLWGKVCKQNQISRALCSALHPQTDGQTEWVHRTLEQEPTLTPPMTKLFQRLVDRAAANIVQAQAQQQIYVNQHRQPAEFADKPRPREMLPPQGRELAEEVLKAKEQLYEVDRILGWRTGNKIEE